MKTWIAAALLALAAVASAAVQECDETVHDSPAARSGLPIPGIDQCTWGAPLNAFLTGWDLRGGLMDTNGTWTGIQTFSRDRLIDKGNVVYDVRGYGAACNALTDGSGTDDTLAIQSAIDTATAAGGGIVRLPSGKRCKATFSQDFNTIAIIVKTNVILEGAGGSVLQVDSSTARATAACHSTATPQKAAISFGDNAGSTYANMMVRDLTVDMLSEGLDDFEWCNGISFNPGFGGIVQGVEVHNVKMTGIGGDAFAQCRSGPGQCSVTTTQQCGDGFPACPGGEVCSNRGTTLDIDIHDNEVTNSIGQALGIGGGLIAGVAACPMKHVQFRNNSIHDPANITYLAGLGPEAVIASPGVEDVLLDGNTIRNWGDVKFDGVPSVRIVNNTVDFSPQTGSTPQDAILVDTLAAIVPSDVLISHNTVDTHTFASAANEGNLRAISLWGDGRRFVVDHNIVRMPTGRGNTGIIVQDFSSNAADPATEVIVDANTVWDSSCTAGHGNCANISVVTNGTTPKRNLTITNNQLYGKGECISVSGGDATSGYASGMNVRGNYCDDGNLFVFNVDHPIVADNVVNWLDSITIPTNNASNQALVIFDTNEADVHDNTVTQVATGTAAAINVRQTVAGRGLDNVVHHNTARLHVTAGTPFTLNEQGAPDRTLFDTNTLLGDTPVLGLVSTSTSHLGCNREIVLAKFDPVENATRYYNVANPAAAGDATETNVDDFIAPVARHAHSLRVLSGTAVAAGNWTVTLRDAAASSSLTCQVTAGTSCTDRAHVPAIAAGDKLAIQVIGSATVTAATDMRVSLCLAE